MFLRGLGPHRRRQHVQPDPTRADPEGDVRPRCRQGLQRLRSGGAIRKEPGEDLLQHQVQADTDGPQHAHHGRVRGNDPDPQEGQAEPVRRLTRCRGSHRIRQRGEHQAVLLGWDEGSAS